MKRRKGDAMARGRGCEPGSGMSFQVSPGSHFCMFFLSAKAVNLDDEDEEEEEKAEPETGSEPLQQLGLK